MNSLRKRTFLFFLATTASCPPLFCAPKIFQGIFGSKVSEESGYLVTTCVEVGDFERAGIQTTAQTLTTNGSRQLFYLAHRPIHRLLQVEVNGSVISPSDAVGTPQYAYDARNGWITFHQAYPAATAVKVTYEWSSKPGMAIGETGNSENINFQNTGNFTFSQKNFNPIQIPPRDTYAMSVGDSDNDGNLDFFVAHKNKASDLNANDGTGTFYAPFFDIDPQLSVYPNEYSVDSGDFDNDGKTDALFSKTMSAPPNDFRLLYRNRGNNIFDPQPFANVSNVVRFGDFDNDGDLDVITGIDGQPLKLYRNDVSTGPFVYAAALGLQHGVAKINTGDLNTVAWLSYYGKHMGAINWVEDYLQDPYGLAVDSASLYVTEQTQNRIYKFNRATLVLVSSMGSTGSGIDQFNAPQGIAVDDTYLYIADSGNDRIVRRLKSDLSYVDQVGTPGVTTSDNTHFNKPRGVAVDDTYLYVTDRLNNRVVRRLKSTLAYAGPEVDLTLSAGPSGIDLDGTNLYVSNTGANRIEVITQATMVLNNVFGTAGSGPNNFSAPVGIGVDSTYVYVADTGNNRIVKRLKSDLSYVSETYSPTPKLMALDPYFSYEHYFNSTPVWISPTNLFPRDLEWADVDGDGRLDIIVANSQPFSALKNLVYSNQTVAGVANFSLGWQQPTNTLATGVAVGDVNNDGNLDLVFCQTLSPRVTLYLGDGTGNFTYKWGSDEDAAAYNNFPPSKVRLADFNADGFLDIAVDAAANPLDLWTDPGWYVGAVVYKNTGNAALRVTKVTSTSDDGNKKVTVINTYTVDESDGSLGHIISTEVK